MSESFDPGNGGNGPKVGPSPDPEAELRRACAELDGHIPDDYFESFSTKLAATLERESMETLEQGEPTGPAAVPINTSDASASEDDRDEHSGLHEIKALAGAARKRITRRRTTESDLEESLLSSSSSGLAAVALPDPEKSTPGIPVLSAPSLSGQMAAASASASFGAGITERSSSGSKPWLWVAAAGVALAATVAVVLVVRGGGTDGADDKSMAAADPVAASASAAGEQPPAPKSEPEAAARAAGMADPTPEPSVIALNDGEATQEEAAPAEEDEANEPLGGTAPGKRNRAEGLVAKDRAKAKPKPTDRDKGAKGDKAVAAKEKAGKGKGKGGKGNPANTAALGVGSGSGTKASDGERGTDIDSILDEVTGGPTKTVEVEKEKKADKKRLDSGDVRRAMSGIGGKINRCQKKTGFTGRVRAKFKVSPSGKVTSAKASGAKGKVARCVEAAVRSARFPSFEPPIRSFNYSFLLAD